MNSEKPTTKHRISIPYALLYNLYITRHLSTYAVAHQLGCSQNTICARLEEYGIPRRATYKELPKEEVLALYESGVSIPRIAKRYGVAKRTLYSRFQEWHIREKGEAPKPIALPMPQVITRYEEGESANSIAQDLGVSTSTVLAALQRHHIPIRHSNKRIDLPLDSLIELYLIHKCSTPIIAAMYHVRPAIIAARLREAGITLRGNHDILPEEDIIQQYESGTSLQDLSEEYQTSYHMIRNLLIRHGVYKKARRIRDCTYEILQLQHTEQLSVAELANHYACHPETIRRILKEKANTK